MPTSFSRTTSDSLIGADTAVHVVYVDGFPVDCSREGAIIPSTATGELFIADDNGTLISLHTYGWTIRDLTPLWTGRAFRGENRIIPGAAGRRASRRRRDEYSVQLQMVISGVLDRLGAPYADEMIGLQANLVVLDSISLPYMEGVRAAELHMPNGDVRTANVQPLGIDLAPTENDSIMLGILRLTIPAGAFG